MSTRLRVWVEQAGADWDAKATIDDVVILEDSFIDEWSAQAAAEEFEEKLLGDLCADVRERAARECDDVANSTSRTPGERAVAKVLAQRIRGGRS